MNDVSKKPSLASKYLAILFLMSAVSVPVVTLGQESVATSTSESFLGVNEVMATTTTLSATTSADTLVPLLLETDTATTEDVLRESTSSDVEEIPQLIVQSPPMQPVLSTRRFERKIVIDKKAAHSCEAETFRIDISGKPSAQLRIMFLRDTDIPYEMEIGGLPDGIDVTFRRNGEYRYNMQGVGDRYLTLEIRNEAGAQKGDFSIPIIYTKKGTKDSSVICQINIINQ